jgi:peptidoglycan/xylan/chitin deacetylase (PgdA/CDA1 family)
LATILTYHHVAPLPSEGEHRGLFVSPESFAAQMAHLRDRGYRVATLDEVRDDLLGHKSLPHRSVAITFDDGGADNCDTAFPILRQYSFPATVFLVTGKIGATRVKPGWPESAGRYLTESEIAEMARGGMTFGSHTLSHVRLANVDSVQCEREIVESKRLIERITGREAGWLSYPFGSFSRRTIEAARRAGYVGAVSTIRDNRPTRERLYFLPRVMVMPDATAMHFAYYLSPWYHWAHWFKNRRRWWKHDWAGKTGGEQ